MFVYSNATRRRKRHSDFCSWIHHVASLYLEIVFHSAHSWQRLHECVHQIDHLQSPPTHSPHTHTSSGDSRLHFFQSDYYCYFVVPLTVFPCFNFPLVCFTLWEFCHCYITSNFAHCHTSPSFSHRKLCVLTALFSVVGRWHWSISKPMQHQFPANVWRWNLKIVGCSVQHPRLIKSVVIRSTFSREKLWKIILTKDIRYWYWLLGRLVGLTLTVKKFLNFKNYLLSTHAPDVTFM